MSVKLKELKQKRAKAVKDMQGVLDIAEKEGRADKLTPEEQQKFDGFFGEQESLKRQIDNLQKVVTLSDEMDSPDDEGEEEDRGSANGKKTASLEPGQRAGTTTSEIRSFDPAIDKPEYRKAFQKYILSGNAAALSNEEYRALQQGSSPDGGFFVPAQEFVNTLIKFVDDAVVVRQKATKFQLSKAQSLGIPSWDTDPSDADWTTEVGSANEDTSMKVGKRELSPHPMSKLAKISLTLLRNSVIPVDTLVLQRLGYKFAITEEKAFLTGSGANKPLGLFTADANGISTGRDVSTDNTMTAPTFDGLKNAKYSIKGQYWNRCSWIFHRDCIKLLAKIKDGEGRYIWADGVVGTEPDTLMGMPVIVSEYAPNTFTTGLYVGLLGDLSLYHIADALDFTVQRLNELFARTNQVGFIGRLETDGMPVLEEGFARVKLA